MSNYHDYNTPEPCPYCNTPCHADFVNVDVGMVQCGPYHCLQCGASQIGPHDDERELTDEEKKTGWYGPHSEPGSSANVVNGKIVTAQEAKQVYEDFYPFSSSDEGRDFIRKNDPYTEHSGIEVICDESNNPPDSVAQNILNVRICVPRILRR